MTLLASEGNNCFFGSHEPSTTAAAAAGGGNASAVFGSSGSSGGGEMRSTLPKSSGLLQSSYPVGGGATSGFVKKLRTQRLLIIGMSANSDSETQRLAKEAGMDHFLEKPFVLADFMKVLEQY
jgi:hypothetical protein